MKRKRYFTTARYNEWYLYQNKFKSGIAPGTIVEIVGNRDGWIDFSVIDTEEGFSLLDSQLHLLSEQVQFET